MRISALECDPGFRTFRAIADAGLTVSVLVNGRIPSQFVVTADEELGEALLVVSDEDGQPIEDRSGLWRTQKVSGQVLVIAHSRTAH